MRKTSKKRNEAWEAYKKQGGALDRKSFDDMQEVQAAESYFKTLHELLDNNIHDLIDTQWAVLHPQVVQAAMTHLKEGPDLAIGIANQMIKGPTLATMAAGAVENMLAQGDPVPQGGARGRFLYILGLS